jgi:hypothetical protein
MASKADSADDVDDPAISSCTSLLDFADATRASTQSPIQYIITSTFDIGPYE